MTKAYSALSLTSLLLISGLTAPAAEVDEQILELEANLCALKASQSEAKTAADFCIECAVATVSATPSKIPVAELTESEKQEFDYLANLDDTGRSLGELNSDLERIRKDLEISIKKIPEVRVQLSAAAEFVNQVAEAVETGSGFTLSKPETLKSTLNQQIMKLKNKLVESVMQVSKWAKMPSKKKSFLFEDQLVAAKKSVKEHEASLERLEKLFSHVEKMEAGSIFTGSDLAELKHFATRRRDELRDEYERELEDKDSHQTNIAQLEESIQKFLTSAAKATKESLKDPHASLAKLRAKAMDLLPERPDTAPDCGLTPGENLALMRYTQHSFRNINEALRTGHRASDFKHEIALIQRALQKFTSYKGATRRGVEFPKAVLDQHQPGQIVNYPAFSSTSLMKAFGAPHQLVIHSKSGRYIAPYSIHRGEHEVLFPPGRFKVLSREDKADGTVNIVLQELD